METLRTAAARFLLKNLTRKRYKRKHVPAAKNSKKGHAVLACAMALLAQSLPLAVWADPPSDGGAGVSFEPPVVPTHEMPPPPTVPSPTTIVGSEIMSILAPVQNPTYALLDISQHGEINISGTSSWTNTGNLVVYSTNPLMNTATLTANTIINPANTSITTILPANVNIAGAIGNLNLVLNASSIYNAGSITSAGALSMHADVIANVAVPTSLPPVMSAVEAVNLVSPTVLNQGSITSALANINIAGLNNSLALNSIGGTFSALNGSVQLGTTEVLNHVMNINALGGDFLSKNVNINADAGTLSAEFNSVSGIVNLRAHQAYLGATEGDLRIGDQFVNGDPYEFSNGNLTFTGITDVDFLVASANNILADTSEGGVAIFSAGAINLTAAGVINLAGTAIIASSGGPVNLVANGSILLPGTQISTNGQQIALVSESGGIVAPGLSAKSNGGRILIAGLNDVVLTDGKVSASIDSSKGNDVGGTVFITSRNGAVSLGPNSVITTGVGPLTQKSGIGNILAMTIAAFNGVTGNDVFSKGGDIFVGSGYATQRLGGGFLVPVSGGQGTGGITINTVSNETGKSVGQGSSSIHASNGDLFAKAILGNGQEISLISSNDIVLEEGITNVSKNSLGGFVTVSAFRNIEIPDGIDNTSLIGSGGFVSVQAGQVAGLNIGGGGLSIKNDSATDGGSIFIGNNGALNIGSGGISSKAGNGNGSSIYLSAYSTESGPSALTISRSLDMADASGQGQGGVINILAQGPLTFSGTQFSANGAGSGSGGLINIIAEHTFNAQGATLTANGGSDGAGGNIQISAPEFTGGDFNMIANGNGTGVGGNVLLNLTSAESVSKGQVAMTATGSNGGTATVVASGNLQADTSIFNVKALSTEEGYGNGGSVHLESQNGLLTVGGNINVDAVGSGRGGDIFLRSGGTNAFVLGADSKLFARGGSSGSADGSGGRIEIRTGGDLTVNADAVLSVSVRGVNGSGGVIMLAAGDFFGPSGPSLLTLNRNLSVNGKGTGNGGSIFLASSGGIESGGMILNGDLQANSGLLGEAAGNIQIDMWGLSGLGALLISKNISANAGENGSGGHIEIGQLGSSLFGRGTTDLQIASTSNITSLGGTASGNGGFIKVSGAGVVSIDGLLSAGARGVGDGGTVEIQSNAILNEPEPGINIAGTLRADGGASGAGGLVKITGDDTSINFQAGASASARSGSSGGVGGEISGLSDTGIAVDSATLDASGRGSANGGMVRLALRDVDLEGGPVETFAFSPMSEPTTLEANEAQLKLTGATLKADAGGTGTGGFVLLQAEGTQRSISVQNGTVLSTYGGTQSGDAGTIEISGQGIFETAAGSSMFANARGGGNGGNISLGQTGSKELVANGDLHANGTKTGKGGNIVLSTESSGTDLLVGQGSSSQITAKGGNSKGNGGAVNFVSGKDLKLGSSTTDVSATSGDAGTVSAFGTNIDCETSTVVATSKSGSGGTVEKTGDVLEVKEGETHSRNVDSLSGKAGTITYNFRKYLIDGTLHLRANSDTGSAGAVNLIASEEIVLGKGHIDLSASGVTRANGGHVNFTTPLLSNSEDTQIGEGTLRIFTNGIGTARSAGSVNLIVDNYGIDTGTVLLSSSGLEGAAGGNVKVSIPAVSAGGGESEPLQHDGDGGVGAGVSAQLIFSEITENASGVIEILAMTEGAKGSTGVSLDSAETIVIRNGGIKAHGNSNGNGNDVVIASSKGVLVSSSTESASFAINANGSGTGNGGAISFETPELMVQGSVAVTADGGASGSGGTISSSSSTVNVSVGDIGGDGTPVQLLARGGTTSGSGGQVLLRAQDQVKVISATVDVSARSVNGNGGSVTVESPNIHFGDSAAASAVTVRATAGSNKGTGGVIRVAGASSSSADQITVSKNTNLLTDSRAGELVVSAKSLVVENEATLHGQAHIAELFVQAGSGTGGLSVDVNGSGAGKGNGNITLRTNDLNFAHTVLFAQGNAGAKAGSIQILEVSDVAGLSLKNVLANAESETANDANGSITISSQNDLSITDSSFSAVGKSGGRVEISIGDPDAGTLTLKNVHADASGAAGSGGKINLAAYNIVQDGSIELLAAGTGAGGTVSIRQTDGSAALLFGEEHSFRANADGQWKSTAPADPSVFIDSASSLILGEFAALTSSSSSVGAKTYAGFIRLSAGNEQPISIKGSVTANGTSGLVEVFANETFKLEENAIISAVGQASSGNVNVIANTSIIAGQITTEGKNGIISFSGSKLDVSSHGVLIAGHEIRVNADASDLQLNVHGVSTGALVLDGNSIEVNFGSSNVANKGLIRIAHAFSNGQIAIRNFIESINSMIVVSGRNDSYAIHSTTGTVELRAADSISLEGSNNNLNKVRGNEVIINQVVVDGPANKSGFVSIGSILEANHITIRADGNIIGKNGVLSGNVVHLTSSEGNIGSSNKRVQVTLPLAFLPGATGLMPRVTISASGGSAFVQSTGGMLVEHADVANTLGLSNRPGLFDNANHIELGSVGEQVMPQFLEIETSQESNGSIIIGGPVKAALRAKIEAGGTGNIEGRLIVGRIEAPAIELRTLTGNIFGGTLNSPSTDPAFALNVITKELKVDAQVGITQGGSPGELPQFFGGTVLINNMSSESLILKSSTAGLLMSIQSGGRIEVSANSSLSAASVTIRTDGDHLTVQQNATLNATNGGIELYAGKTINILRGTTIAASRGNVGIVGGTGVNLSGSTIRADANGGNAAVGNVSIATLTPSETELVPATNLENFTVNGAVLWGSGRVRAISGANRATGDGRVVSFDSDRGNIVLDKGTSITAVGISETQNQPFSPISFLEMRGFQAMFLPDGKNKISVESGFHIWYSNEDFLLLHRDVAVRIKKGTWVQTILTPDLVIVRNLSDARRESVQIGLGHGRLICVNQGEEFIYGNHRKSSVPFRSEQALCSNIRIREFSIPALVLNDTTVADLYRNHPNFRRRLLKTSVCLSMISGSHGAYRR